jgi:2-polyprenyl-3-methyl-5-hydroxy-6-metoxy-1,4-benzoquinol methylase/spore coat polysaccharide biosynthesis predicted glycosyltransferase SpsG
MNSMAILIIPCCEEGRGGGHLNRCITFTNDLRALGRETYLYLPEKTDNIAKFLQSKNINTSWIVNNEQINRSFGLVILDRFQTPRDELLRWKKIAPLIGIDEGGRYRDYFDFLIDILIPEGFIKPSANITSCGFLELPKKIKTAENTNNSGIFKILISFGQEDAAGLGLSVVKKLSMKNLSGIEITLLKGGLNNSKLQMPNFVKVTDSIPNLADHLYEYDLVVTHYGITAYEAVYAGTRVLLDHPTLYHKKLAKDSGFLSIKYLNSLIKSVKNQQNLTAQKRSDKSTQIIRKPINGSRDLYGSLFKKEKLNLAELCSNFLPIVNRNCPVCGADTPINSISRFNERTYRRCSRCGVIYMDRTCPPQVEYEEEYFNEFYKKQYGKTYLEDFDNIKETAKIRLKTIKSFVSTRETLLDIGCAFGPFLSAAHEEGFIPAGIDPIQEAVRYVREHLGIPAVQGYFPNCKLPEVYPLTSPSQYNVITLWYVIEHFTDCLTVLKEIKKLLIPGGILAFSTPSYSGISGRANLINFLSASPADHWTIWSPLMCKRALTLAGFKVKKIIITGHHPERFPFFGKFAKSKKSLLYWLLLAVSKIFGLGDTFEVYAQTK